jgi:hypothetical protein
MEEKEPIAKGAEETFKQIGVNMAKPLQSPAQITNKEIAAGDVFSTGCYE